MLKDYQAWAARKPQLDLFDYVTCVATPDSFFAFLELFLPDLVLHEGNYFLASHFEPRTYDDWKRQLKDPGAVQKVMNHVHISTLFQQQEIPDLVARAVARQLAVSWSITLAAKGLVTEMYGDTFEDLEGNLLSEERVESLPDQVRPRSAVPDCTNRGPPGYVDLDALWRECGAFTRQSEVITPARTAAAPGRTDSSSPRAGGAAARGGRSRTTDDRRRG